MGGSMNIKNLIIYVIVFLCTANVQAGHYGHALEHVTEGGASLAEDIESGALEDFHEGSFVKSAEESAAAHAAWQSAAEEYARAHAPEQRSRSWWESAWGAITGTAQKGYEGARDIGTKAGEAIKENVYEKGLKPVGEQVKSGFETFGKKTEELANKAREVITDTANQTGDFFKHKIYEEGLRDTVYQKVIMDNIVKKGLLTIAGGAILIGKIAAQTFKRWFYSKMKPEFCPGIQTQYHTLKTIDDPSVIAEDTEGLIPYIKRYAPIMYLHEDELYYPIWPTEWCTGPQTSIKNHHGETTIIAPGQVTMERIYELYKKSLTSSVGDIYIENPACVTYGSNPAYNRDAQGNLNTPVTVVTYQTDNNIYIQYLYLYGFNGPYDIGPISGDKFDIQNAHEADLEHITLELDKTSKAIKRIYYGSHGRHEGFWIPRGQAPFEGEHPVAYVALGGHGNYPREGTYVRIYGIANDITGKHIRWAPQLIRLYGVNDPRFDPKSMGWITIPGGLGRRGVSNPAGQAWWMNSAEGDIGRSHDNAPFCKNPSWTNKDPFTGTANQIAAEAEYAACITANVHKATPPE